MQKPDALNEDQIAQCDARGFYTVSQGYRKVPGDRCMGGLDMNPIPYSCSPLGYLSARNIIIACVIVVAIYYGWPLIEGVLIMLPLPDPSDIKEKLSNMLSKGKQAISKSKGKSSGYSGNFKEAPESLGESDEEDNS